MRNYASNTELVEVPDQHLEDIIMKRDIDFMRMCEDLYLDREAVLHPPDSRMQQVRFAIHTWILKLTGTTVSSEASGLATHPRTD